NHQITKTQTRKEDFAETTGIDDRAALIEALKRGNRTTSVAIFAVVVIFKNPRAGASGPVEELHAATHGHHRAQRKLMGRSDINESWAAAPDLRLQWVEPIVVHRDGHDLCRKCFEHRRDDGETRVLHTNSILWIQQHTDCEFQPVLDSRHDDDFVGSTLYSARLS